MRLALLFPGQGVQHAGMLPWLDLGDRRALLADPLRATTNANAQMLMTSSSLAAWHALRDCLPRPVAIAGYSVGELAAFSAAGVFDADQALAIATLRADAMDRAARDAPGGLLSVIGASDIDAVCRRSGAELAIRIAVDRVVLGGSHAALSAAEADLASQPATLLRLPVQVASHTSAMRAAAVEIAGRLVDLAWQAPTTALVTGFDGAAHRRVDELKQALAAQTAQTVQWQAVMQTVAERRPDRVLEVGAGSSLSRIWRAAHADVPVRSVDEFNSAAAIVDWVSRA